MEDQTILQEMLQIMKSLERRMDSFEKRMDSFEKRMDSFEKRLDSMEHSLETVQKDIRSIKQDIETLDTRQRAVSSTLETVTNRNISIIAENHIELNKKLYQILETENDVVLYKITTNRHTDLLDNLEQRVAALETAREGRFPA
ncbi:hypothetical protein GKG47_21285 [Lactonifactor sp. BIOML-A3]|uniref:hypothetical protein n=1 Tax=Lactonifactor TaxID=420345 RepID=UPI0012AF8AAB|nr:MULTISPECIES: hypothetical protein [Lactonifactor]MCB5712941.1 hypothetical protein [Lactonifactor longoviformis]MCB5717157.1 hypothetical protein [Lactonifactor longoviformis]MSA03879.1 hypothetical protein [Lactonifactor sp. BIOML-A5]MSA10611.1 hypothetical protein [Lactonifactor sp. BIOML-A4]MSA14938.1 hypothetical protein [Lactonifactor sp. BIOML-A3]